MDERQTNAQFHQGCVYCNVIEPQMNALIDHLWPAKTREHFRNARIEVLKGMRSILDARIQHVSQHDKHGTKVTVE
ncbi:MAG: hypothetical protein ABSB86_19235 [Bryobacteraceae bacterium]